MLTFNTLLIAAGVDLASTKIVRHKDNSAHKGRSPYDLWRTDDKAFELYQQIQSNLNFKNARWLASFVVTPLGDTLFAGVYEVGGVSTVTPGMIYPSENKPVDGNEYLYDLKLSPLLGEYRGRIVIDWGPAFVVWVQNARDQDKSIVAIHRRSDDRPFPGFGAFKWRVSELASVPHGWREALATVAGGLSLGLPGNGAALCRIGLWYRRLLGQMGAISGDRPRRERRYESPCSQ